MLKSPSVRVLSLVYLIFVAHYPNTESSVSQQALLRREEGNKEGEEFFCLILYNHKLFTADSRKKCW